MAARALSKSPSAVAARRRRAAQRRVGGSPAFWSVKKGACFRKHGKCASTQACTKPMLQARLKKMHHSPRYQKNGITMTKAQLCAEVRKAYKKNKGKFA